MTATSAVSPGRPASPGSSGSQRNPMVSRSCHWIIFTRSDMGCRASAVSAIAGALAASLAPDTLTTARIATLAGVTEVHHGWRC
jgi:hypothetical protein